ncbi:unnamed protein product, partial [Didymodactylos carnosus]
MKSNRKSYRA